MQLHRRSVLALAGATGVGAWLRPLIAAAEGPPPLRLVFIHRPCGTIPSRLHGQGSDSSLQLGELMAPFAELKSEIVDLDNFVCARDTKWPGDQHGAGIIGTMVGWRAILIPGTSTGGDANSKNIVGANASIDQYLLRKSPLLKGPSIPSLQLGASKASADPVNQVYRIVTYAGSNQPLRPEVRPSQAYARVIAQLMPGGATPDNMATAQRLRLRKSSVLDLVKRDIARLQTQIPSAQRPKLEAHVAAVQDLEKAIAAPAPAAAQCRKPSAGAPRDGDFVAAIGAHFDIMRLALQCDLTRTISFTFANGNSNENFSQIAPELGLPSMGHHTLSHSGNDEGKAKVDLWYSRRTAAFIQSLRDTPEGNGTLLDHSLVVYWSEVSRGAPHSTERAPVTLFGRAGGRLKTGRYIDGRGRYTNDIWTSLANSLGIDGTFGDPALGKGAVAGLFS